MKASMVLITLSLLIAPITAQDGAGQGGRGGGAPAGDPAAAPTPRLANGKPDLTGSWGGGGWSFTGSGAPGATVGNMFRRCTPFQSKNCMEWTNQSEDWVFMSTARLDMRVPIYKPEHWDKMIEMDQWTNRDDPVMTCLPLGIPRQGPPARIFATDTDITFIYRAGVDGAGGYAEHRMIAIDGKRCSRGHPVGVRRTHDQRAETTHLFFQQADGVIEFVAAQRVGADELSEAIGLVNGGRSHRPHLVQHDADAQRRGLPRRFAPGQAAADDVDRLNAQCSMPNAQS